MASITVHLGEKSYPILIEPHLLSRSGALIAEHFPHARAAIVTDTHVGPLYLSELTASLQAAAVEVVSLTLPSGERTKCMDCLMQVYAFLSENGITRSDLIIALGGGVIGDLTGLAAATWLRGVRFCQIPTSLLAQVDSSVGGKVAIDLPQGKNLIGAFHQPSLVLCDPDVLTTLPDEYWRDGLGEVVKYGCIQDPVLFSLLERLAPLGRSALMAEMPQILYHCIHDKAVVVEQDEHDTGVRMTLNFGHTLAHAIETCQHYEGLRHGEAVSVGMHVITRLSESRGLTESGTADRLDALLHALCLPTAIPPIPETDLLRSMHMDKKHAGQVLRLILLKRIGISYIYPADTSFFEGMNSQLRA